MKRMNHHMMPRGMPYGNFHMVYGHQKDGADHKMQMYRDALMEKGREYIEKMKAANQQHMGKYGERKEFIKDRMHEKYPGRHRFQQDKEQHGRENDQHQNPMGQQWRDSRRDGQWLFFFNEQKYFCLANDSGFKCPLLVISQRRRSLPQHGRELGRATQTSSSPARNRYAYIVTKSFKTNPSKAA